MTDERKVIDRMDRILKMDKWLYENVGDDVYTDIWLCYGLEDGGSEDLEILREYAENDDLWLNCLSAFSLTIEEENRRTAIGY